MHSAGTHRTLLLVRLILRQSIGVRRMPQYRNQTRIIRSILLVCLLVAFHARGGGRCGAAENWTDVKLPVTEGLELWLDASHAKGQKPLPEKNDPIGTWRDGSGKHRDVTQADANAKPRIFNIGTGAFVRFDGIDDHLRAIKTGASLESFTVFIVAAPRQNLGSFRGFMAFNAPNARDYESGLTIDLGPSPAAQFNELNVEGKGFGGAQSLRKKTTPLGKLNILAITSDLTEKREKSVHLTIDGSAEGQRPREGLPVSMDEVTIGARFFDNGAGPQRSSGFGRIDLAEVLVYGRALTPDEFSRVEKYLAEKYAALKNTLPPDGDAGAEALKTVDNAPPVQMLVPGFSVRELPVDLTNINNVKYRADGTLVALGYDGRIWLLRDTNGDGLEDKADLLWDNASNLQSPIGLDVTPPGYPRGNGVFVNGKSRCVLIVDKDGDDKADEEIQIAGDWKQSQHSVDGVGIAIDPRDGSVYYGRGCGNYLDPLLRDKDGKSEYQLSGDFGTVIKVSPDFKTREIVATGIRFPIAIRLNARGDLFCTDQEGATWVPNGNPFDELLHVQKGRHYGFPSRHPQYLPNIIDEPSTFDYAPQHESTCGLNFNDPIKPGAAIFGPAAWRGDALVCGESRGKLYRTKLAQTSAGYVAQTNLFARLGMLTIDGCVGPAGEFVVTCHSGAPDWGTGPTGKGKLYKITYDDPEHPQPVAVWPAGPREVRVEFDRPVPPELLHDVLAKTKLVSGRYARAGDRFETMWPGYAVVQMQKITPRFAVPVHSAQLTPNGRTLVLATDSIAQGVHYALTLPDNARASHEPANSLPQHAEIDLDFDLTGCAAKWQPAESNEPTEAWLPHVDLDVSQTFMHGSAPHAAFASALRGAGELTLRGQLDLTDMLRPAVQPGSKLDYSYPPESVTVTFSTKTPKAELRLAGEAAKWAAANKASRVSFTLPADAPKLVPFELKLTKPDGAASLAVEWTTNEDARPRPLPLRRLFVPWADLSGKSVRDMVPPPAPELAGGSWARGYREFYGEQASCSKCHSVFGRGGTIGPDLSNLVHRDYISVVRDITHPSFALNPDFLSYVVTLKDGRVLTGVLRTSDDSISIGDTKGVLTTFNRSDVEEIKASPISTMPEKLPEQLGPERMRDLLTFLLTPPPSMPHDHPGPRPRKRTVAEVEAALAGAPQPPEKVKPLRLLLVAGPQDHGIGEHDYPAWQKAWSVLLSAVENVEVDTAWEWPKPEQFQRANVVIFNQRGGWNDRRAADVDPFLERGGGLVYIHWSLDGRDHGREFAERIGLSNATDIAYRHGPLALKFMRETNHPIIRNFDRLEFVDESYWNLGGPLPPNRVLGTSDEEGQPRPQLWTTEPKNGRVFVCIPGHYSWTYDDPLFRVILLRGIAWVAREPVDRFNELVWLGADR